MNKRTIVTGSIIASLAVGLAMLLLPQPGTWQGTWEGFHIPLATVTLATVLDCGAALLFLV